MQKYYDTINSLSDIYEKGPDVKIVWCTIKSYIPYNLVGRIGKIVDYRTSSYNPLKVTHYAVRIDGLENQRSARGLFWLEPECLEENNFNNEKEKENMNINNFDKDAKFAILRNTAKNCGNGGDVGAYYGELKPGDIVVCDYGYDDGALSVRVVELIDQPRETLIGVDCEIISVCDTSEYISRKEKKLRYAELKTQMIERAKKYHEEEYWRLIAELDPTMKALYDEFKSLES